LRVQTLSYCTFLALNEFYVGFETLPAIWNNGCVVAIGCAVMTSAGAPLSQMSPNNDSRSTITDAYTTLPNSNLDRDFYTSQQRGLEWDNSTSTDGRRLLLRKLLIELTRTHTDTFILADRTVLLHHDTQMQTADHCVQPPCSMIGCLHDTFIYVSVCLLCFLLCAQSRCRVESCIVLAVQRFGVRLVVERSLVRIPAGAIKSTRSTQPSIPPG